MTLLSSSQTISLRTRILLVFASASLLTLLFITISIYVLVQRGENEGWVSRQIEAGRATNQQVRSFISQAQNSHVVLSYLQSVLEPQEFRGLLALILLIGRNINEIVVTDGDGQIIHTVSRTETIFTQESLNSADWVVETLQVEQETYYLGELEFSPNGVPYFTIASPNRVGGMIAFNINVSLASELIQNLSFGKTGNAYVVDSNGDMVAHTDLSVVNNKTTLAGRAELPSVPSIDFIQNIFSYDQSPDLLGDSSYTNFEGIPVLGIRKVISGTDYVLFVEVSQEEAFTNSRNAIIVLGGFSIISWVFSMFGFTRLLRDLLFKPLNNLQAGEKAVEKGNFDYQIPILRDDELGQVTSGFNRMTQQLLERTQQREAQERELNTINANLLKANRELAVARRQAEAANKLKSQFLSTMSHELRTPLNAVIGYSQLQLAGMVGPMSDEQKGFQERILINAQHLLQLINEVLDISKIEAGRMDLVQRPISLRAIFDEVLVQNRVLAENKGLGLELVYDDRLPEIIIGDRGRLKQIIINLISNGIKFTDKGKITVEVVLHNKDTWRVIVTDTGVGIPPQEQEVIFDEFRQAENGLDRGGTGLGLAIVRKLVIMMGGNIRVTSELGAGSVFTITFPIITELASEPIELTEEE
ncbi:MAG: ATP-binding protein [bacterium]|nr:ATP-binding protein [bacterium]